MLPLTSDYQKWINSTEVSVCNTLTVQQLKKNTCIFFCSFLDVLRILNIEQNDAVINEDIHWFSQYQKKGNKTNLMQHTDKLWKFLS